MRKLLLALLLWGVPVVAHASCAQIIGGDDAGGCVEIDSCGGDACLGTALGVFLDPVYDGTEDAPFASIGLTSDQVPRSTFHIAQKIGTGVGMVMTTPASGHNVDGFRMRFDDDFGGRIENLESGTDGNITIEAQDGEVALLNDPGFLALQADGDTAISDDLELTENLQFMTNLSGLRDLNGNELLITDGVLNAVNEMTLRNAPTGVVPTLAASGTDTNISMTLAPKGAGGIDLDNDTAPMLVRLLNGGTLRGTMRASVFAGTPLLDFISGSTTGQIRVLNSAETISLMTCDDGLNDACSFQASRLVPQTTMPTCNAAFEGAMAYDGDGVVNGPCVCVELVATVYTWTPLLATAPDCA